MAITRAQALENDPRWAEARRLIQEALLEHTGALTLRAGAPEEDQPYHRLLDEFGNLRGAPLYYEYLGSGLGRGPFVELADGSVKLDFIAGIGVHILGHNHPAIVEAHLRSALRNTTMQGNLQQNVESHEFVRLLLEAAQRGGSPLRHCILSTSGAMANENALKICFQKHAPARRLLAFERSFAGRTLALSQITDKPAFREGLPPTISVDYLPYFDAADARSTDRTLRALRTLAARYPGDHAGMILELVQGEGGFNTAPPDFFRALMKELRALGIGIVLDEVQTFGRTSEPFAFQLYGLHEFADIVTVGKCSQVCATLYADAYQPRPGLISQTFTGSTAGILAGTAILRELLEGGYYGKGGRIEQIYETFARHIRSLQQRHPDRLKGPYGLGGMVAFQVDDGSQDFTKQFAQKLFREGLIAFTAGSAPARIRFLLPVGAIGDEHLQMAADCIDAVLRATQKN